MAYEDYNSVPLGTAGTGAAYLLNNSTAANQPYVFLDNQAQQAQQAQTDKEKQAQQLAAAWQKNHLNIKGGTLFQPEINKRAQQVMDMGVELQKAGINPNNVSTDPQKQALLDKYNEQKTALLRDADMRDKITKQADEYQKEIGKQDVGYYDPESVAAYHKFIDGSTPLSEISAKGYQMPQLQKAFNLEPLVEKIPGVPIETTGTNPKTGVKSHMVLPDEAAHMRIATGLVNNNPAVQADITKKAGIPYAQIGTETDPVKIKADLDAYWRSAPNVPKLASAGISSFDDPKYQQMVDEQATAMANAAKVKNAYIGDIKTRLDDKVHKADDKSWDFAYQNEQDRRERLGMERERFGAWKAKQQNEEGVLTVGNQDSYVPVLKKWVNAGKMVDKEGKPLPAPIEPEKGASLYGVNLPNVETIVRPALLTDTRTGKTIKNTDPLDVKISQIQMVPVFTGLPGNDPRNGSEISLRQFREMAAGTNKTGNIKNITFQPFAYGLQSKKGADGVHTQSVPVKFSYDALKRSGDKKINTTKFDQTTQQLNEALQSPEFKALSPSERVEWFTKNFNWKE